MKAFTYHAAASAEDAVKLLGENSLPIAGGTNILNLMKDRVLEPDAIVDVRGISGGEGIESDGEGLRIGGSTVLADVLAHARIRSDYPCLAQAIETLATPQIRNMATIAGNLCGRTACWYYTNPAFRCARRGDDTCSARGGENHYHAIFENHGPCVSVHSSSTAPALIALDARVGIVGPKGKRESSLDEFFVLPTVDVRRENALEANEIVTHVTLGPARPHSATYEIRHKHAHDWPVGFASVALELDGRSCRAARICLGAAAPVPLRSGAAEKALAGKRIDEASAAKAAEAAVRDAHPLAHNHYKVTTTRTAVKRAILLAATGRWM